MCEVSRGKRTRAASHCCSSVLHDNRVEKGRLTLMNLELDFRRHIGGDVGQRIELGQQHSFRGYPPQANDARALRLFVWVESSNVTRIVRVSRLSSKVLVHVAETKMR